MRRRRRGIRFSRRCCSRRCMRRMGRCWIGEGGTAGYRAHRSSLVYRKSPSLWSVRKRCGPEDRRKPIVTVDVLQSQLGILCAAVHVSVVEEQNDVPTLLWHATLFQLRAFSRHRVLDWPGKFVLPSHFEPAGFCVTVPCTTMLVSSTAN